MHSTLIHESTHFRDVLGTIDHGYGADFGKKVAQEDPDKAVNNAEYAYFSFLKS